MRPFERPFWLTMHAVDLWLASIVQENADCRIKERKQGAEAASGKLHFLRKPPPDPGLVVNDSAAAGRLLTSADDVTPRGHPVVVLSHGLWTRRFGAERGRVLWLVMREVAAVTAIGTGIGVPVAIAASRLVESQLFGISPTDPLTLAGAAILLIGVALFAGWVPAAQAARVDPLRALRHG